MQKYDPEKLEPKWQEKWQESGIYKTKDSRKNPKKFYALDMFPYPSGAGLHVGHPKGYIATDAVSRKKILEGYNVLHPMGWDAFGLPTENYAIKNKIHPRIATEKNIETFKKQLEKFGFTYDWDREINTTDPEFYKWTQWIFLKMFEKGLAYQSDEPVNWCPSCKTVLANEDLEGGLCERCGTQVIQKKMKQWVLKMTAYADRLLNDLDSKDLDWEDLIKEQQRNWIGRSEGAEVEFPVGQPIKKKILIGTRNEAKVEMVKNSFLSVSDLEIISLNDLPEVDDSELKETDDYKENARRKAEFYYSKTGIPTISTDHIVWLKKWPKNAGIITHFREEAGKGKKASDEEVMNFIEQFVQAHGQSKMKFIFSIAYADKNGVQVFESEEAHHTLQGKKSSKARKGYPMDSYIIDSNTGKYLAEQSDRESYINFNDIVRAKLMPAVFKQLDSIKIYTTRLDTIYGCTYCVLAPEHKLVAELKEKIENYSEIEKYVIAAQNKTEMERTALAKEKTGMELKGIKAINPFTAEEIPVWVADYVLGFYGTGAVMAVPAHDERDFEFAKKYGLPIKVTIRPTVVSIVGISISGKEEKEEAIAAGYREKEQFLKGEKAFTEDGVLINSGKFSGLTSEQAREEMTKWLENEGIGQRKINYKMRDWVFSRQRYWGEPIPIIHCAKCGAIGVPEKDLPVKLPDVESYEPTGTGESPLAKISEWVNVKCPKCSGAAKRETNTMPQWAGSSWYYLRYIDPKNKKALVDKNKEKAWMPVDLYVGGAEHATRHLLYARFWHKFLYDIGVVSMEEPFKKLFHVGLILAPDGRKMSKRWGNVINPDDVIREFGADSFRLYEMFMGPFSQSVNWSTKGVVGMRRFLERVWQLNDKCQINVKSMSNDKLERLIHKTIKKVGEDIEEFKFNTAISALMILSNEFEKSEKVPKNSFEKFLILLSPFAPHIAEDLWYNLGNKKSIFFESWPKYDLKLVKEEEIELVIQINGKVKDKIKVAADISEEEARKLALASEKIKKVIEGKEIKKVIFVKGRLINIVM